MPISEFFFIPTQMCQPEAAEKEDKQHEQGKETWQKAKVSDIFSVN